ncbi:hypothetical protein ABW19_dt0200499 [Dactylella cylindrospora]|nr:hypothetical protein ABW19_dt0200499 [Dactylella cylindrospora]
MGILKNRPRSGLRRRVLEVIVSKSNTLPNGNKSKSHNPSAQTATSPREWRMDSSPFLLLPAELLCEIFAYLDSPTLQHLFDTHPRFRGLIAENRSHLCKLLAFRDLRYFARYLPPIYFDLQKESLSQFLPESSIPDHGGTSSIPAWYRTISKLSTITDEFYKLLPSNDADSENEYRRIQGLSPLNAPPIWPRPGYSSFYFTHTILAFYQYNSLIKGPKECQDEFVKRGIKSVSRCPQGYFRSTAHLGMLCVVYMACLRWLTGSEERDKEDEGNEGDGESEVKKGKDKGKGKGKDKDKEKNKDETKVIKREDRNILAPYLPELGGGIGNYLPTASVTVKELFKMLILVTYPGNLLKVVKEPNPEVMKRLAVILKILRTILDRLAVERRGQGIDRWYAKGGEMMDGFVRYWENAGEEQREQFKYFGDWDEVEAWALEL